MPRKFNIAFDGGGRISALDDTNDIGFHAVRVSEARATDEAPAGVYFQLTLGGITGHKDFARYSGVLVAPSEALDVAGAIVRVFVKKGDRTDRTKARLKYVLDAMGFDAFVATVEAELGRSLRRFEAEALEMSTAEDRNAHIGFHPQKQEDRYYLGVVFPVGRIQCEQLRQLAEVAQRYGTGEMRLTVWQNLIIPHLRAAIYAEPTQRRLPQATRGISRCAARGAKRPASGLRGWRRRRGWLRLAQSRILAAEPRLRKILATTRSPHHRSNHVG